LLQQQAQPKNECDMRQVKSIELLNKLVTINNDRIKGYEVAITETHDEEVQSLFIDLASTSRHCRQLLIEEIQRLGGHATKESRLSGKIFRVWMDVKAALTGRDLRYVLDSCDFGEAFASSVYQNILTNKGHLLSSEQNDMIRGQYENLSSDRTRLTSMQKVFVLAQSVIVSAQQHIKEFKTPYRHDYD